MKLLEYEAKAILRNYSIPTPDSVVVTKSAIPEVSLPIALKSQVPIGGRGKLGGIVIVDTQTDLQPAINRLFELSIRGFIPNTLLAETKLAIKREYYLSVVINKTTASIELLAHIDGGMDVEDQTGFQTWTLTGDKTTIDAVGEQLAEYLELPDQTFALQDLLESLYRCFVANDATLLEINPLVLTDDNQLVAGDCKMELDSSAAFRHPEWQFEGDVVEANFVTLNESGTVATIANGAGLAMATVDAVAAAGMTPANFLDIGGGASTSSVLAAFERIMTFDSIQAIVINIFAGITKCDEVAHAIIAARKQIDSLPPLYIRLAGTNFEEAVALLSAEGMTTLSTLGDCLIAAQEAHRG